MGCNTSTPSLFRASSMSPMLSRPLPTSSSPQGGVHDSSGGGGMASPPTGFLTRGQSGGNGGGGSLRPPSPRAMANSISNNPARLRGRTVSTNSMQGGSQSGSILQASRFPPTWFLTTFDFGVASASCNGNTELKRILAGGIVSVLDKTWRSMSPQMKTACLEDLVKGQDGSSLREEVAVGLVVSTTNAPLTSTSNKDRDSSATGAKQQQEFLTPISDVEVLLELLGPCHALESAISLGKFDTASLNLIVSQATTWAEFKNHSSTARATSLHICSEAIKAGAVPSQVLTRRLEVLVLKNEDSEPSSEVRRASIQMLAILTSKGFTNAFQIWARIWKQESTKSGGGGGGGQSSSSSLYASSQAGLMGGVPSSANAPPGVSAAPVATSSFSPLSIPKRYSVHAYEAMCVAVSGGGGSVEKLGEFKGLDEFIRIGLEPGGREGVKSGLDMGKNAPSPTNKRALALLRHVIDSWGPPATNGMWRSFITLYDILDESDARLVFALEAEFSLLLQAAAMGGGPLNVRGNSQYYTGGGGGSTILSTTSSTTETESKTSGFPAATSTLARDAPLVLNMAWTLTPEWVCVVLKKGLAHEVGSVSRMVLHRLLSHHFSSASLPFPDDFICVNVVRSLENRTLYTHHMLHMASSSSSSHAGGESPSNVVGTSPPSSAGGMVSDGGGHSGTPILINKLSPPPPSSLKSTTTGATTTIIIPPIDPQWERGFSSLRSHFDLFTDLTHFLTWTFTQRPSVLALFLNAISRVDSLWAASVATECIVAYLLETHNLEQITAEFRTSAASVFTTSLEALSRLSSRCPTGTLNARARRLQACCGFIAVQLATHDLAFRVAKMLNLLPIDMIAIDSRSVFRGRNLAQCFGAMLKPGEVRALFTSVLDGSAANNAVGLEALALMASCLFAAEKDGNYALVPMDDRLAETANPVTAMYSDLFEKLYIFSCAFIDRMGGSCHRLSRVVPKLIEVAVPFVLSQMKEPSTPHLLHTHRHSFVEQQPPHLSWQALRFISKIDLKSLGEGLRIVESEPTVEHKVKMHIEELMMAAVQAVKTNSDKNPCKPLVVFAQTATCLFAGVAAAITANTTDSSLIEFCQYLCRGRMMVQPEAIPTGFSTSIMVSLCEEWRWRCLSSVAQHPSLREHVDFASLLDVDLADKLTEGTFFYVAKLMQSAPKTLNLEPLLDFLLALPTKQGKHCKAFACAAFSDARLKSPSELEAKLLRRILHEGVKSDEILKQCAIQMFRDSSPWYENPDVTVPMMDEMFALMIYKGSQVDPSDWTTYGSSPVHMHMTRIAGVPTEFETIPPSNYARFSALRWADSCIRTQRGLRLFSNLGMDMLSKISTILSAVTSHGGMGQSAAVLVGELSRLAQAVFVLCRAFDHSVAQMVAQQLCEIVRKGHLPPDNRTSLELVLAYVVATFPNETMEVICKELQNVDNSSPVVITSMLLALGTAWFHLTPTARLPHCKVAAQAVAPWTACARAVARTEAQVILSSIPSEVLDSDNTGSNEHPFTAGFMSFLKGNKAQAKLIARFVANHVNDFPFQAGESALTPLFKRCSPNLLGDLLFRDANVDRFHVIVREVFEDFLDQLREDASTSHKPVGGNWWVPSSPDVEVDMMVSKEKLAPKTFVQRKPDVMPAFATTTNSTGLGRARQSIVVVASLVDRYPNLGGLARTCEVFRARTLVVNDLAVKQHDEFLAVAVNAEQWVPMIQVKPSELESYLIRLRRQEGFVICGLEQSLESVALQDFSWPDNGKVALVLGNEVGGIPAEILRLLDVTLEIPQLGVIRSLNVHVSASLCLWQYTQAMLTSGGDAGKAAREVR